jgi:ADP-dependent NAD(P)H-hydrate dehydratase / NAD(P)H-hydrate epimerase
MEDASIGLWRALEPLARACGAGTSGLLLAICGTGNNGGDALALLRHARFSGLTHSAAILSKRSCGELASLYAASLASLGVPILAWNDDRDICDRFLAEASLIVDGLSGSGQIGPMRENVAGLIGAAHATGAPIASIDLPSGLSDSFEDGYPLVAATWTLSIEPRKACLYFPSARESCGEIVPIEGVFPVDAAVAAQAYLLEAQDISDLVPLPPDSAYKGERGRVAVFAGSIGASGAAVLASRSCLAAGAGIAALFASRELYPIAAPMLDAVMVKLEPTDGAFDAERWDALLIGPGWGRGPSRLDTLAALLGSGLPAVLDADAIGLYRILVDSGFASSAPIILTPHPGEFAALTGIGAETSLANPVTALKESAKALNAVIVLKSHVTWIASPEGELAVWDGRESGLGTAGSGDVLAGLAAGLLGRSTSAGRAAGLKSTAVDAFAAARCAVIAHGLAGRRARELHGWFEAGAIIEEAARILGLGIPS